MAERDSKGRFVSKNDSGESGGSSANEGKRQERITVNPGEERGAFEDSINRRHAGRDIDTAAERAHDIIASEGDKPRPDGPSAEEREAARERAKETGRIEDAARALEQELKAADAEGDDGESAEARAVRFAELADELGVDADSLTIPVKIDGEEREIPLREAQEGYQRQADYTRKTQQLAEQRQEVQELQAQHAKALEMIGLTLGEHLTPEMRQQMAVQYNQIVDQLTSEAESHMAENLEAEQEALAEELGWEDESDALLGKQQLRSYAKSIGFSDDEISNVTDHRLVLLLDRARRFEEGEQGGGSKPVQMNPGTRHPNRSRTSKGEKRRAEAREKLRRTGSIHDAAAALDGLLD